MRGQDTKTGEERESNTEKKRRRGIARDKKLIKRLRSETPSVYTSGKLPQEIRYEAGCNPAYSNSNRRSSL